MSFRARTLEYYRERRMDFCWACGRGWADRPDWWGGPWGLHLAHLSAGSGRMMRKNDRRLIVLLDPACHELHTHWVGEKVIGGVSIPTLSDANMIHLKATIDPVNYDPDFIREAWLGVPPEPEDVPETYRQDFRMYRRWFRPIGGDVESAE